MAIRALCCSIPNRVSDSNRPFVASSFLGVSFLVFRTENSKYRKNFYDSPSQEEVVESRLGRKSQGSETKFLEMD